MDIQKMIEKRQHLVGLRNSASDHTYCPECRQQLIFCDCISTLSEEILDELLEISPIYVWTNGKAVRKFTGQDKTAYSNRTVKKGFAKYKAILIPQEEGTAE